MGAAWRVNSVRPREVAESSIEIVRREKSEERLRLPDQDAAVIIEA
jgi:hypothetical protein